MKICIPIKTQNAGGGFYFIDNLRKYLDEHHIEHTQDIADRYDVLFLNSWHVTYYQIMTAWRRNPEARLVHRIDGAAEDYGRFDGSDKSQHRVSQLADRSIFQSSYCRFSTREKFPVITQSGPVIWNPVDLDTFTPDGPRRDLPGSVRVCYATYSTNPMKGAPLLYETAAANPEIDFMLCGRYEHLLELPNLHPVGHLGREDLAIVMRSCDVFLIYSKNEACPNVVLEAMSSGLPVLYLASGATPELVRDAGLPVTPDTFRTRLAKVMADRGAYAETAHRLALRDFDPEFVFPQYLNVVGDALDSPPRVSIYRRKWLAYSGYLTHPVESFFVRSQPLRRRLRGKLRTLTMHRARD